MSHKSSNGSGSPTTTTNGTPSAAATGSEHKYEVRLCHVIKRADFDGYGFNLHAEKGRPGQYIGKVDDGSPAESAGLRQGDRIIEVNGTNITNETHKKVVELIKGVPNETKLLVIDPRADAGEVKAAIARAGGGGKSVDVNDNSKQQSPRKVSEANGKDSLNEQNSSPKQTTPNMKHDVNGTKEEANNKKNANNNVDSSGANKMMMTNGDTSSTKKQHSPPPSKAVNQIIEDTKTMSISAAAKSAEANGKPQNGTNGTVTDSSSSSSGGNTMPKEGPKLNLNMTAAELRAQLAARKKYDPKNDVCDLRKKYEIIQKM